MNRKTLWIAGAISIAFILTAGFAFAQHGFPGGWHSEHMRSNGSSGGRGHHGRMHGGMMHGADHAFDSEADYLSMMVPHHEEAVERAQELLALTEDERMVELLESIIAEQTAEIAFMEAWLADHYPNHDPRSEYEPMMRPYDDLSAEEAELVFIEDMIPHHMHAIMSSQALLSHSEQVADEIRELATSIVVSQRDEIHVMHDLYADLDQNSFARGMGMMRHRNRND